MLVPKGLSLPLTTPSLRTCSSPPSPYSKPAVQFFASNTPQHHIRSYPQVIVHQSPAEPAVVFVSVRNKSCNTSKACTSPTSPRNTRITHITQHPTPPALSQRSTGRLFEGAKVFPLEIPRLETSPGAGREAVLEAKVALLGRRRGNHREKEGQVRPCTA